MSEENLKLIEITEKDLFKVELQLKIKKEKIDSINKEIAALMAERTDLSMPIKKEKALHNEVFDIRKIVDLLESEIDSIKNKIHLNEKFKEIIQALTVDIDFLAGELNYWKKKKKDVMEVESCPFCKTEIKFSIEEALEPYEESINKFSLRIKEKENEIDKLEQSTEEDLDTILREKEGTLIIQREFIEGKNREILKIQSVKPHIEKISYSIKQKELEIQTIEDSMWDLENKQKKYSEKIQKLKQSI